MAAISDVSDLVNRLSGGGSGNPQHIPFQFVNRYWDGSAVQSLPSRQGIETSFWRSIGIPTHGLPPTTVAVPTSATAGAIPFVNASGGRQLWLTNVVVQAPHGDIPLTSFALYDRLLHIGGLDGTVTSAQTVAGTLTRNTGGVGNKIFLEIYTDIGSTLTSGTVSYTNQDGTAARTGTLPDVGGDVIAKSAGILLPIILQAGDTGVKAVASVTLTATTGTAGDFGITIMHALAETAVHRNDVVRLDLTKGLRGPVELVDDACLVLTATSAYDNQDSPISGLITLVEA